MLLQACATACCWLAPLFVQKTRPPAPAVSLAGEKKSPAAIVTWAAARTARRVRDGSALRGPVDAAAKPLPEVHSIWELVLHVAVWDDAARCRLGGKKWQPTGLANFPAVTKPSEAAWRRAVAAAKRTHDRLVKTVAALPDSRLGDRVPGKRYDFYHMLHGIAQHELYHAGQIAILKKTRARSGR